MTKFQIMFEWAGEGTDRVTIEAVDIHHAALAFYTKYDRWERRILTIEPVVE